MLYIQNNITDPYFNLASEEYLLKHFQENCFMLWRNKPSVIVGKHQNTLAEINYEFVKKNNIPVVRRLSGGGTVFHDLGNLNFTFIQNVEKNENLVDFKKYTKPIIEVLNQLGVDAKFEGRNDIKINGKKVSGNAEHVFKKRVLHHGTLLFSSEIKDLSQALKINPLIYSDKGVKSVRSQVANIKEYLSEDISVLEFRDRILKYIIDKNNTARLYEFIDQDIEKIKELTDKKYSTWEWNFAYSPKYDFKKSIHTPQGDVEIQMSIEKGLITSIHISGNLFNKKQIEKTKTLLIGQKHKEDLIHQALSNLIYKDVFDQISVNEFVKSIF